MKNKKLLLVATAAMGVLALGTAGVGTAAWFEATTSAATVSESAEAVGALSVEKTSANIGMDATIHFDVDTSGDTAIKLTTWSSNDLKTGTVPKGGAVGDVTLVDGTGETLALPIRAWITDDADENEKSSQGHNDRFLEALTGAKTTAKKVTFTYANKTASDSILGTSEVYFYCGASGSYAKGSEGISGASGKTQQCSTTVADLCTLNQSGNATAYAGSNAKVTIGYLFVRFEGSTRVHTANSYSVTLSATAGNGAAQANQ